MAEKYLYLEVPVRLSVDSEDVAGRVESGGGGNQQWATARREQSDPRGPARHFPQRKQSRGRSIVEAQAQFTLCSTGEYSSQKPRNGALGMNRATVGGKS